jgi:hypothetical protein
MSSNPKILAATDPLTRAVLSLVEVHRVRPEASKRITDGIIGVLQPILADHRNRRRVTVAKQPQPFAGYVARIWEADRCTGIGVSYRSKFGAIRDALRHESKGVR